MPNGYEEIYQKLIPRLSECDFEEAAARLGFCSTADAAIICFLGREFHITKNGVSAADGQPINVNTGSVLIYYVLSKGRGEPAGTFAPLFRLTGLIEGRNAQEKNLMIAPLIQKFGHDYGRLEKAISRLGAVCEEPPDSGFHVFTLNLLPKIPAKIVYYEADEEFSADIQLLLDENSPKFLEFECLAFLAGCLTKTLIKDSE